MVVRWGQRDKTGTNGDKRCSERDKGTNGARYAALGEGQTGLLIVSIILIIIIIIIIYIYIYIYVYIYIYIFFFFFLLLLVVVFGKGLMGSALMGSLHFLFVFWQRDLLGTPVNLFLSSQKCQGTPFFLICQNSLLLQRPH